MTQEPEHDPTHPPIPPEFEGGDAETHATVVEAIRTVYDPEIPINIYDLGLIYAIRIDDEGKVRIEMTLTSPNCPEAEVLPSTVQMKVRSVLQKKDVEVEVVWEPQWTWERMSEAARLELNL